MLKFPGMPSGFTTLAQLQSLIRKQGGVGPQSSAQIDASISMLQMALQAGDPPKTDEEWLMLFHDADLRLTLRRTVERVLAESKDRRSGPETKGTTAMGDANATMMFSGNDNPLGA